MARPTKFDPLIGRLIVARVAAGATRGEAATEAGVALRAVQYWIARGRKGEAPYEAFAKALDASADAVRINKLAARRCRMEQAGKARGQAFKAAREGWWLDRLGPVPDEQKDESGGEEAEDLNGPAHGGANRAVSRGKAKAG